MTELNDQYLGKLIYDWRQDPLNLYLAEEVRKRSIPFFRDSLKIPGDVYRHKQHTNYFELIGGGWESVLRSGMHVFAVGLIDFFIDAALDVENKSGKQIHKGTPYYFRGVSRILAGDLVNGFMDMHLALEEDKKAMVTLNAQLPAGRFVTLKLDSGDYFYTMIMEMNQFLEALLSHYQNHRNGQLQMGDFRSSFMENEDLYETVFLFVYNLFCANSIINRAGFHEQKSQFSSIYAAQVLSELCLIMEQVLRKKIPEDKVRMRVFLDSIKDDKNWAINFQSINDDSNNNGIGYVLKLLLQGGCVYSSKSKIENDFGAAYACRNFGAHDVSAIDIIREQFSELYQRVIHSLFFVVEHSSQD